MLSLSGRLSLGLYDSMAPPDVEEEAYDTSGGFEFFEVLAKLQERMALYARQDIELKEAKEACAFMNTWAKRLGVRDVGVSAFRALNIKCIIQAKMDLRKPASGLALILTRTLTPTIPVPEKRVAISKMAASAIIAIAYKSLIVNDVHLHLIDKHPEAAAADVLAAAKLVMVALEVRYNDM